MSSTARNTTPNLSISSLFSVKDWVCLVSGGGTGIGLMITQALAANGAKVYITSRRGEVLDRAAERYGGEILPLQVDVNDKESIEGLVRIVQRKEEKLDLLVNCAGVALGTSEVEKGDDDLKGFVDQLWNEEVRNWDTTFRTNVTSYFFMSVGFLPLLSKATRENHTGSIINISSMSGITRTSQHHFAYNASKAATIQLNNLLAQEFRRNAVKVRVNSIAPGIFHSQMTTGESPDDSNKNHIEVGHDYGEKKGIPAGRPGAERDMAQAVIGLAVNQYAYGQTVVIDGGYLLEHP